MPKKKFILKENGRHTLELTWRAFWKNFTVYYDGAPIDEIEGGAKGMRAGKTLSLPDGSKLSVKLKQDILAAELEVLRDGKPLPGSATDPIQRVRQAYVIIFIVGGFNLVLGIAGIFFETELLYLLGAGWGTAAFGLFLLILGWLVKERQSQPALITAIVLYLADSLLGIAAVIAADETPGIGGLIVRVLFIIGMAQGIKAIAEMNRTKLDPEGYNQ